jgi:2'-5' RNA ligase
VPAHLTLFHHLPPGIERELGQRLSGYAATAAPQARIVGVTNLGRGTAFRVESEELADIRYDLAKAFQGLLIPQDQAPWRPHITIQNKVEPREAKRLQAELEAGFEPRPLSVKGLASWRYMGGPWHLIREHVFRG